MASILSINPAVFEAAIAHYRTDLRRVKIDEKILSPLQVKTHLYALCALEEACSSLRKSDADLLRTRYYLVIPELAQTIERTLLPEVIDWRLARVLDLKHAPDPAYTAHTPQIPETVRLIMERELLMKIKQQPANS